MKSEDGTGSRHPSWRCGNVTPPISFISRVATSVPLCFKLGNVLRCLSGPGSFYFISKYPINQKCRANHHPAFFEISSKSSGKTSSGSSGTSSYMQCLCSAASGSCLCLLNSFKYSLATFCNTA